MSQTEYKELLNFLSDCCEEVEEYERLHEDVQDNEIALEFSSVWADR